ncbi:MAG: class I SAM-dependent methyltransferase, partial [Nitrospinota bacterium]
AAAAGRVVVKRPLHAPPLAAGPDWVLRGRSTRFDVYLTGARKKATEAGPRPPSRGPRPG